MKKVFLFLAAAAMIFVGCKNEEELQVKNVSETEFEVKVPILNRAAMANNTFIIDRIIMQIVDRNSGEIVETITNGTDKLTQQGEDVVTTFNPRLQLGRTYDYLFWADNEGYYDVDTLSNVTLLATEEDGAIVLNGNDIKRDAFFAAETTLGEYTGPIAQSVELHRPFAQVNLRATDIDEGIQARALSEGIELSMTYTAPSVINVATGEVSEEKTFVVKTDKWYTTPADTTTVFMDYIYVAAGDEKTLIDLAFVSTKPNHVEKTFATTPVQRNWITNLTGELYHASSVWTVEVKPAYEGTTNVEFTTALDIKAANEAFAAGATKVQILNVGDETTLYLPKTTAEVFIEFTAPDADITVDYAAEGDKPATVNITTDAASKFDVSALTNSKINWFINNQTALDEVMNVVSANNIITFSKEGEYVLNSPLKEGVVINGQNNATLYFASTYTINVDNVVLNDLTIKGSASNTATSGTITVSKSATFNNCTMVNSSSRMIVVGGTGTVDFNSCDWNTEGKGRGIMVWGGSPVINVDGCTFDCVYPFNVDGGTPNFTVTNSTLNGWISYMGSAIVSFENCELGKSTSGYAYCRPYGNTTFTGCQFSEDFLFSFGADGVVITLTNCTQAEQPVTKAILDLSDTKAGILMVDGKQLYPVLVAFIGEQGYETIAAACAAAQTGETVTIVEAGEYTMAGIPNNITLEGVDGVKFNCVGSGSIASIPNGCTFKNLDIDFGQSSYHGFQHAGKIVMEECTLNGLFFSYSNMEFNGCTFVQTKEEYNMWTYAGDLTFNDCDFHGCGKFLNVYRESRVAYNIVANNCSFESSKVNKSAFNVKETSGANLLEYNVSINGCTTNDNFPTDKVGRSKLWMVDDLSASGETYITVKVDGVSVYPFE